MQTYPTIVAGASTNVVTPSTGELNQGNDQLTVYNSAKNNGYYRQISAQVFAISAELINVITAAGLTPGVATDQVITALRTFFVPIGSTIDHAASTVPMGFLECDGSAISRTTYSALFAIIGTTWGSGDGSTTFNIPDLRGYFKRGWSHGSSVDSGRTFASTQQDAFQAHWHEIYNAAGASAGAVPGTQIFNGTAGTGTKQILKNVSTNPAENQVQGAVTDGTNGTPRTAAETRPVNKALLICIKY